jgi:plasmid stabilization system protein ParE
VAELNWTAEAVQWLRDIYDYIALDSPEAAERTVQGIYEQAQRLRQFPKLGYRYQHETGRMIRVLLHGHYRIAYLIKSDLNIDILGVFHGSLDLDRYLR